MDNLEKVQKTSPDRLNKMNKTQLENLILGSLKEIGVKLNKLDRIEDKLNAMEQKVNYKRIKKTQMKLKRNTHLISHLKTHTGE